MRVLKGRPLRLSHTFLDDEDVLTPAAVTVTLTDAQGSTVATGEAADDGAGNWSVSLPMQPLGVYTATWDGGSVAVDETPVEVVGGFLFSIPQVRASDDYLADAGVFPAQEIREYREVVDDEFEKITGRSFVTRSVERTFIADDSPELVALIPDAQSVDAVTVNGVAVDDLTGYRVSRLGKIIAPAPFADGDVVTVRLTYGYRTPPADVARVGMIRLRALLAAESSGIPDRATTYQATEGGTFRLATAGQGKWKTGIPEVDSTLQNYALDTVLAVFAIG
jgi:hypothetical protein